MNIRNWQPPALLKNARDYLPNLTPILYTVLALALAAWCWFTATEMTSHLVNPPFGLKLSIAAFSAVYFGFLGYGIGKAVSFIILDHNNRTDMPTAILLLVIAALNGAFACLLMLAACWAAQFAPYELFGWMTKPSLTLGAFILMVIPYIEMGIVAGFGLANVWER